MELKAINQPLMLSLLAVLVCNRLINALASDEWVWPLHDLTLTLSLAIMSLLVAQATPYRNLVLKCIVAVISAACWADFVMTCLQHAGAGLWYAYSVAVQGITAILLCVFYVSRSYDSISDELTDGFLFCLRTRPRGMQDLLISMSGVFGPNGGYILYANGITYRYKKGVLIAIKVTEVSMDRYQILKGASLTPAILKELESNIGRRWTLFSNCVTVLGSIWRRHRGS